MRLRTPEPQLEGTHLESRARQSPLAPSRPLWCARWPHFEENGSRYMPFPFYLAYAAALLENDGFTAAVFDGCATKQSDETYLRRVVEFAPDIVIQENATASINVDLRWAETLKSAT